VKSTLSTDNKPLIEEEVEIDTEDDENLNPTSTSNPLNLSNMNITTLSNTIKNDTQNHRNDENDEKHSHNVTNKSKELVCESCSLTFTSKQEKETHFSKLHCSENHHQNKQIVQKLSLSNSESSSNQTLNKVE
jgi:hypothetical protein